MSDAAAPAETAERLIVALDHPSLDLALAQVDRLGALVTRYKVGLELYLVAGRRAILELGSRKKQVFLDLKFHDIPETVERAARAASSDSVDLVTVHAAGGRAMLEAAVRGANAGRSRVLAITVLTSLDEQDLASDGIPLTVEHLVVRRAELAKAAGCRGVVASAREVAAIRRAVGPEFLIVTPGVRPESATATDDQKRVATARQAREAGADAVVVGRPIRDANDPLAMVQALLRDLV